MGPLGTIPQTGNYVFFFLHYRLYIRFSFLKTRLKTRIRSVYLSGCVGLLSFLGRASVDIKNTF